MHSRFDAETLEYIGASPDDFNIRAEEIEVLNNGFVLMSVDFNYNIWNPRTGEIRTIGGDVLDRLSPYADPLATSRDGSRVYFYGEAIGTDELTFFSYDTSTNTATNSAISAGQRGFLRTGLDGSTLVLQEQVFDDSFQLLGSAGDVIVPTVSPNGEVLFHFDSTDLPTPVYWFTAKDLRSPDGAGGFNDFFPRRDVTATTEIESDMFRFGVHPDLTSLFFFDEDKMRIVSIP